MTISTLYPFAEYLAMCECDRAELSVADRATVDQHSTLVRQTLVGYGIDVTPDTLAAFAAGVVELAGAVSQQDGSLRSALSVMGWAIADMAAATATAATLAERTAGAA